MILRPGAKRTLEPPIRSPLFLVISPPWCTSEVSVCSPLLSVHTSREPGWLEGTLDGRTGLIPENYVEIL